jgi:putative NADH-flavin reductase
LGFHLLILRRPADRRVCAWRPDAAQHKTEEDMKIAVIGASGRIGSRITNEAVSRGHTVTAIARSAGSIEAKPGVTPVVADLFDTPALTNALKGHDVVIAAFGPGQKERADDSVDPFDLFVQAGKAITEAVKGAGVKRLQVVGGAASLKLPSGEQLVESDQWPPQFQKNLVKGLRQVMYNLKEEKDLDWVFFSPAIFIEPGVRTGKFRLGKDHIIFDDKGESRISMEDYSIAMVDEAEQQKHHQERFTIGY